MAIARPTTSEAAAPAVEMSDVCFAYRRREVVHDVSLRIDSGGMVAMVGPNGGGKTTLLKLMLGLLEPRHGRIALLGGPPKLTRQRAGYVPQQVEFDPDFPVTAMDIVLMGRIQYRRAGPYSREDRRAARTALEQVGMPGNAREPLAELSGGQRQRVMIAQALAAQPELLLLDEPTAGVDNMAERAIFELLHRLNETCTIIMVSHNLNVVTRHVSHVICVNHSAVIRPIESLTASEDTDGIHPELQVLVHDLKCQVMDAWRAQTPEAGAASPEGAKH